MPSFYPQQCSDRSGVCTLFLHMYHLISKVAISGSKSVPLLHVCILKTKQKHRR